MIEINNIVNFKTTDLDFPTIFEQILKTTIKLLQRKEKRPMVVNLVSDKEIQMINRKYRQKDRITDVISFSFDEQEAHSPIIGEIYICIPQAKRQSLEYNHSVKREICFLFTHGLLHLLGFDHMNETDSKIMFDWQEKILKKCDIERTKNG